MADLFEFMLGKKESKKEKKVQPEDKNNYSIYMPVGIYDGSDIVADKEPAEPTSRRGDYNPYELDKLKEDEQLVELKREISTLEDDIRGLNDKIVKLRNKNGELSVEKSKSQYISGTYRSVVEKIVKIMPYYQEIEFTGIGVPEQWADRQLVEMFVTCIENIKLEYSKSLKEIEKLKENMSSIQNSVTPKEKVNVFPDIPEITTDEGPFVSNSSVDSKASSRDNTKPNVDYNELDDLNKSIDMFNDDDDFIVIPSDSSDGDDGDSLDPEILQRYYSKIEEDNQLKVILETIGETGLSRVTELKDTDRFKQTFTSLNGEFSQGPLSKKFKVLEDMEILEVEKISTGRKGGQENIYSLSNKGVQLYKLAFSAKPVESEKEKVRRQHTSLEHGYFIKTVAIELNKKGYEVLDAPEDLIRTPLVSLKEGDDKLRVEADLIIRKGNDEFIIECEMGTTSDLDMAKKLDKLVLVTNVISFIMNNQESLNKTSMKVDKWITKQVGESLQGYTFRFTTLDSLKKNEIWQNKIISKK